MPVALDEARDGELAVQIDHLGIGTNPALCGGVRPERGDLIAAHRDGLRGGRRGIHGDDLAVAQDQVRGLGEKCGGEGGLGREEGCAHGV